MIYRIALFLFIGFTIFLLSACDIFDHDSDSDGEVKPFYLVDSIDQLTNRYEDCSVGTVVSLSFNKAVETSPEGGDSLRSVQDSIEIYDTDGNLFKVFEGETLREVEGDIYVSADRKELTFVPRALLLPGTAYRVLISSLTESIDGEYLDENYSFELKTNESGEVLSILLDRDEVREGDAVSFSADASIPLGNLEWKFNRGDADSCMSDESSPVYVYETPGLYEVGLEAEDLYHRQFSSIRQIRVYPDLEGKLNDKGTFFNVCGGDVDDETLACVIDQFGYEVISSADADLPLTVRGTKSTRADTSAVFLSDVLPGSPLISFNIRSESVARFGYDYIYTLITEEKFLGIVSFKGFPSIVSYVPFNDYYILELFVITGDIDVQYRNDTYDIDLELSGMTPTPGLHKISVPISESVLRNLQRNLPSSIRKPLPVFYTDNGSYMLDVIKDRDSRAVPTSLKGTKLSIGGSINLGVVEVSVSVGTGGVSADVDVNDALQAIYDFLTDDLVNLLVGVKNFLKEVSTLNPFGYLSDVKDSCDDIKDEFVLLYNTFQNAGGVISHVTDPEQMVVDMRDFLYANGESSVKSVAGAAINVLNQADGAFQLISDPLLTVADAGSYLAGFIPATGSDAHVIFYAGTDEFSLKVKTGSARHTISLDTLNTISEYADTVLDSLGADFPLDTIITRLDMLQDVYGAGMAGEVGYYYTGSLQELKFKFSILSGTAELSRLQVMLSPSCSGLDVKVTNPLSPDTWVLLEYEPFPFSVTDSTVDIMFDMLALAASPFPNITLTMQTKYRDIAMQLTSRLRPAYSFSAYVNLGMELNYYVVIGGKGEVGIQLYVGVDGNVIAGDVLKDVAVSAFEASRDSFSEHFSTATIESENQGMMSFPDEKEFIDFMYSFLGNLRSELVAHGVAESLLGAVTVGVSPSAEVGIGLGAGGTGTGGGAVNLSVGTAFDVNANLLFFRDTLLAYYRDQQINSFFMKPLLESMQAMNAPDRSNPFDVKGIAKLFEEGFTEIIEQLPEGEETETFTYNTIDSLFNSMAENVSFGISFQAGIDGELEEVADIEAGFAFGPSISANGEFVFNTLYPILYRAFEIKGTSQAVKNRLNVLDQPGIFPEISFAIPLSGSIEIGFDEGVQVNLGLGAQMDYIEGTVTLQGDPFRTAAEGGMTGSKTILSYPVVTVTQFPETVPRGEAVAFSAGQSVFQTGTTMADTTWFLNGQEIDGTGAITENDEVIADVTAADSDMAITLTPQRMMEYRLRCEIEDSEGRSDFDYIVFKPANGVPEQPVLTLVNGSEISRNALIPVSATDPDSDPLTYDVIIAGDAEFATILFNYSVSGTHISLPPEIADGRSYYLKVRAFDGGDYGPWSTVSHFSLTSPSVELLLPVQGHSFVPGEQTMITFSWNCDAEYARIQISDNPEFNTTISDVFQDFNFHEITGSVLQGLTPGIYYWRVAGYNGFLNPPAVAAAVFDWSVVRSFYMRPPAPMVLTPDDQAVIPYNQTVPFAVQVNPDVDSYEFEYSQTFDFSAGNEGLVGTSSTWQAGPLLIGGYVWYARVWKDGIESAWSDTRSFSVVNEIPSQVYLTSYQQDSCIDGVLELTHFWAADPEGGSLTYSVSLVTYDGTGYNVIKTYKGISSPFSFSLAEGGYNFYVTIEAVDECGAGGKKWTEDEYLHIVTENCPPPAPKCLVPADGHEIIRDGVTLEVEAVTDVDGDPIDHYEFLFRQDGGEEILKNSPTPTALLTDLARGEYSWKVRAVSGTGEGGDLKTGEYSQERRFSVLDNQPPETANDSPAAGSVFSSVNWITLAAQATDDEGDEIEFFVFELADSDTFDNIVAKFKDIPDSSVNVGMQLPAGIYYWHADAADLGGYGDWSEATCFSVIDGVEKPTIADAGNETEFTQESAGTVSLTFNALIYTTDCLGGFTGILEYELRNDQDNLIAPIGTFENGVPFDLLLPAGNYFWKARHIVAGLASDWSDPLAITVLEGNGRPAAENITPAGGGIFNTGDEIILTLRAIDPDEDPLQSWNFQCDQDSLFSEPLERLDQSTDTANMGALSPGIYYWRGNASDAEGYGDWSEATCFSVIGSVEPPDIAEAGNPASYRQAGGAVEITFYATTHMSDCLENPVPGVLHYEISVPEGTISGTFESGVPFILGLVPGSYSWRARHEVAGLMSEWTEPFQFEVLEENGRPVSENVTPETGEMFAAEDLITLTLGVDDPDEDPILAYDFEYDTSINFDDNPGLVSGALTGTVNIAPLPLPADTYYWRGRASDAEGYGDWSNPTCFSVIAHVDSPDIAGAENDSEFACDGEGVTMTFHANPVTLDCTGGFAGTFVYEISGNEVFDGSITGNFEDGVPFFVSLEPGTYYWRARHVIAGIESDPSTVLQFAVSPENQPPTAENDSPDGDIYLIENPIILTLNVSDPNGNEEILSYDFEYDVNMNFDYEPQRIYGEETNSVAIVPPVLSEDTYYWRGRASDAEGPGAWSSATCFTVIEGVDAPLISDAGNASEYQGDGERVTLTFYVNEEALTTNCNHEPVGTLFYEISADSNFNVTAADGNFESGVSFTEWLSPGTYYWRAQHIVNGLESEWSGSLEFAVTGAQELLLIDEDFESGLVNWTQVQGGAGIFVLETIVDGDSTVFHYRRYNAGTGGGEAGIQQSLDAIDITGYSAVYLEFDVKLIGHTLTSSGSVTYQFGGTGEFPADARLYFTDTSGSDYLWNHGFMLNVDPYGRSNYTVVPAGEWYHYTSPNLIGEQTTQTPAYSVNPIPSGTIVTLNTLRLRGEGWNFEGEFDNVKLILIE